MNNRAAARACLSRSFHHFLRKALIHRHQNHAVFHAFLRHRIHPPHFVLHIHLYRQRRYMRHSRQLHIKYNPTGTRRATQLVIQISHHAVHHRSPANRKYNILFHAVQAE